MTRVTINIDFHSIIINLQIGLKITLFPKTEHLDSIALIKIFIDVPFLLANALGKGMNPSLFPPTMSQ